MDKFYFIEVMAYQSVNKMGLELGEYVKKRYDKAVVHANCIYGIKADIEQKIQELQEKHPRCRPFELIVSERDNIYGETYKDISVAANKSIDSYVCILNVQVVRRMNLEYQLNY